MPGHRWESLLSSPLSRRGWFAAQTAWLARPAAAAPVVETVSMQPEFYHGWPTLARRRDGTLVAVWSGGREQHVCPFGRVELMRSSDGGRTWSWPQVLMDSPIDDRDAGIVETLRGTLLATTFTSLAYEAQLAKSDGWPEERRLRWQAVQARTAAAERRQLLGCWMLRSTDGGVTWSAPYRVPVNSPHGPVALADGRLLYAGKRLWDDDRAGLCESADDGQSWRWLAEVPLRPSDSHAEYHELHAVEAGKGRIVVHIRNHNRENAGETLQSESADGGKSWSAPHSIGVWGLPSHLLRLRDGRLLMTYGYRRPPFGNQARTSVDQGRTWAEPVVISANGASGDLGYPSTVELDSGELVTLWYERLASSPKAVLRQARWRL